MAKTQSPGRRRPLRARLAVAAGSLALLAAVLALAEGVVRLTNDQPLLGTSAHLFVPDRFAGSRGNARGAEAVAFGETVYLDDAGFRVPARDYRSGASRALLVVGDSVAFGPGVPEPETVAGRLRRALPDWNVLNAAVIGHAVGDYPNVVRTVLSERDDVREVVLVYCLNDLSVASAAEIERALEERAARSGGTWIDRLRSVEALAAVNRYLRERSKLYLLLRNNLSDSPRLCFLADHELYTGGDDDVFARLQPLAEIEALLRPRGIGYVVVVAPYAWQLREPDPQWLLPQRLLARFLAARGIRTIDATDALAAIGPEAFLPHDPMHLSVAGHGALAELVRGTVGE